jgi:chemotaxis protein CheY-P-specific phosphatase CheC
MSALSHTSKGTPVMLVVSLFSEDGCNVLISSSGTTVPSKQLYQREWVDPVTRKKTIKTVERCEAIVDYFNDSTKIDELNRKVIGEIQLIDSWQGAQYWWKVFLRDTSACVVDMYYHMKKQGELHIRRSNKDESVVELMNRLVGGYFTAEKQKFARQVVDVTTPKSKERHYRMVGPDRRHPADGEHVSVQGKFVKKQVKKGVRQGKEYLDPLKKSCLVCKAKGTKVGTKQPRFPQTVNTCVVCKGHVHGPTALWPFNNCWKDHLHHRFVGLANSGSEATVTARASLTSKIAALTSESASFDPVSGDKRPRSESPVI